MKPIAIRGASICSILSLLLIWSLFSQNLFSQDHSPRYEYLQMLFLGDDGHHQPAERARIIQPVFATRGIHMDYTTRVEDLRPEKLERYDAVLIYANHDYLGADQERALLEYVRTGGGLVPVHSASAMFQNSEAYIRLVGGAFKAHGAGTFQTTIVEPDHPAVEGVSAVESWDETYVHTKHNPDRRVLSVREEDDHREPWTWVREVGDGRVFYTAWGHDERTWGNADFQRLLEQGLRWAAGDWALQLEAGVSQLDYEESEVPLPYYPEGEPWGTTGEPITQIQQPLSPEESMNQTAVPAGFDLHLFASEPDIVNPIDMAWDEDGRLWVVETFDYPNELREGEGSDRVRVIEDTNGDGRADSFTTFAEGLNIPTSIVVSDGGVIVMQAPHTLFLKDTTGDGRADVREELYTGWDTFDTHAGPSNLTYGFDNQIWGSVGYAGFDGVVDGEEVSFPMGFYRFETDGSSIEYLTRTSNNTWGFGFNEEGYAFGSTANGNPAVHLAIPFRYYDLVDGLERPTLPTIADSDEIYPVAEEVRQVDHHGRYTAGSGFQFYTAREFPREYWNRTAFVSEPTGHLLGKFSIEPDGAGFSARNEWNMLASRDEWVSPIVAKTGPDGMLWVIDWYNLVTQHNPTPENFESGEGNAYETPLRDREHARIYRIAPSDMDASYNPMQLSDASSDELVAALEDNNLFWRTTAQRLLVERGEGGVLPALFDMIRNSASDEVGNTPGALHALWTIHGLGALDGTNEDAVSVVSGALHHPSSAVRRSAYMALPRTSEVRDAMLDGGVLPERESPGQMDYTVPSALLQEADARVRLAALLAFADMPTSDRLGSAIGQTVGVESNVDDERLRDGLIVTGSQHAESVLPAALRTQFDSGADSTYRAQVGEVVRGMTRHYAAQAPHESFNETMLLLPESDPGLAGAYLSGVAEGWPENDLPELGEEERTALRDVRTSMTPAQQDRLDELIGAWGIDDILD